MVWLIQKDYSYRGPTSVILANAGSVKLINVEGISTSQALPPPPCEPVIARQEELYDGPLSDMFLVEGSVAVSDKFRKIVDSLEPEIHWFAPLVMQRRTGEVIEGKYWLFQVQQDVDCIITENDPEQFRMWNMNSAGEKKILYEGVWAGNSIVVSKPAVVGRHIWTSGLLGYNSITLCSDEFKRNISEAGCHGVRFDRKCVVVDKKWIAEEQMGPLLPRHIAYVDTGRSVVDYTLGEVGGKWHGSI